MASTISGLKSQKQSLSLWPVADGAAGVLPAAAATIGGIVG